MEIKSAPYEILLRFTCEKGEKFGYLRGMHAVMEQYAVDDEGNIIGRIDTGAVAQTFTEEELKKFLGEPFVIFAQQLDKEREDKENERREKEKLATKLGDVETDLESVKNHLVEVDRKRANAMQELAQLKEKRNDK